uniref:cell division protein FtsA n=1 Tax=Treponema endosymbiont of Eucomonympha sp. TaxID=1580831 RepID=UPI000AA3A970
TVIGEITESNALQISGIGKSVSMGLQKGVIVNIEAARHSIAESVENAEMMSPYEVHSCVAAIGGSQVDGFNSKGLVAVLPKKNKIREINREDIERVIDAAKAIVIPMDRQILHVIPQSYAVDGQRDIKAPLDMICVRLEVEAHIITSAITPLQNIQRCLIRANYELEAVMLKTLAAVRAVMTEEELDLGSILIDLGGGTTDILVLTAGAPVCTISLPIGGSYVTSDISIMKGISFETAERIKLSSGCCWEELLEEREEIIIPGVGGRPPEAIPRTELCRIIQPRMEEILIIARREIVRLTKTDSLSGNIVLTGGGTQLPGVVELTQTVFNTSSVRIGYPEKLEGIADEFRTPEYATAIGLVMRMTEERKQFETKRGHQYNERSNKKMSLAGKAKKLLGEFF